MKYIDAEKLKKAIEDKGLDCSFALKMERLDTLTLIDSLQQEQPSLPSNLDEAAEEYAHKEAYGGDKNGEATLRIGFKAGAEWMAGQGVTCEGVIFGEKYFRHKNVEMHLSDEQYDKVGDFGDKVVVQIRKK